MNSNFELKFSIPLTFEGPQLLYDNIMDNGMYLDPTLVQSVYMPVHIDDGGSARYFYYGMDKRQYRLMLKSILRHKPIAITYPEGNPSVVREYCELGIREFLVRDYLPEYDLLKTEFENLTFTRSIVGHAYDGTVDSRFDGITLAYIKQADIEYIKKLSEVTKVTVIANSICNPICPYLDLHAQQNDGLDNHTKYVCPGNNNTFFIPREILLVILPYVTTVRLFDRALPTILYEKCISYYTEGIDFDLQDLRELHTPTIVLKYAVRTKGYRGSVMSEKNCEFKCKSCVSRCY